MKKIILMMIALAGLAFLQSCRYDWVDPIDTVVPENVSFSADIIPIFNNSCVGCHKTGGTAPDLSAANAYNSLMTGGFVNVTTPESSKIYTEVASGGAMNGYSQPGNADVILKWIQQGALNN